MGVFRGEGALPALSVLQPALCVPSRGLECEQPVLSSAASLRRCTWCSSMVFLAQGQEVLQKRNPTGLHKSFYTRGREGGGRGGNVTHRGWLASVETLTH